MNDAAPTVGVIGAGSWGTALAMQLARTGNDVVLWARDPRHAADMQASGRNVRYLPDVELPQGVRPTHELEAAVSHGGPLLLAVPSHAFAGMVDDVTSLMIPGQGVAWACKGFEPGTGKLLHEVARDRLGDDVALAAVTGPSFAKEVALDLPTAVTVAGIDEEFTDLVATRLHGGQFRAYTSSDMIGAELGGAVKNVLAVATGVIDGMGLGDNARAALITRGLAEMMRLGAAMGARSETLIGLAGLGDLVLTCTGDQSRNRRLGLALGRGQDVETAVRDIGQVVEGVGTSAEVRRLSKAHEVSMPISREVYGIIHQKLDPAECLRRLLARDQKPEYDAPDP